MLRESLFFFAIVTSSSSSQIAGIILGIVLISSACICYYLFGFIKDCSVYGHASTHKERSKEEKEGGVEEEIVDFLVYKETRRINAAG